MVTQQFFSREGKAPATMNDKGLADAAAASPFVYPGFRTVLSLINQLLGAAPA